MTESPPADYPLDEIDLDKRAKVKSPLRFIVAYIFLVILSFIVAIVILVGRELTNNQYYISYYTDDTWHTLPTTMPTPCCPRRFEMLSNGTAVLQMDNKLYGMVSDVWIPYEVETIDDFIVVNDVIWAVNAEDVFQINETHITRYPGASTGNSDFAIGAYRNKIFIVDSSGNVSQFDGQHWRSMRIGDMLNRNLNSTMFPIRMVNMENGYLWLQWGSIWRYDGVRWEQATIGGVPVPADAYYLVGGDEDRIWLWFHEAIGYLTSDFKFWDYRSFGELGIPDNTSIFNVHQTDAHFYLSTYSDPYAYLSDSFIQTPLTPLAYSDDAEGDWIIANRSGVLWSPGTRYDYSTSWAVVTYLPLIDIMLAVFVWYLWWRSRPTFDYERAYAELIAYFPELSDSTHIPIRQSSIVKQYFWSAQIAIGIFLVVLFLGAMYPLIGVILPILGVLVIYLQVKNWTAQMAWLGRTISSQERRKYVIYITGLVLMSLLCMCAAIILGSNSSERLFLTLGNLVLVALIYFLILIFALIPNARMNFHKAERNATVLYRFFQFMPNIIIHYAQSRYIVSHSEDSIDLLWGIALRHKLYPASVVCSAVTFLAMDCSQRNYAQAIKLLEFFAGYYPKANYLLYVLAGVYLDAGVYPVRAYDLLDHANMRPLGMGAMTFDFPAIKEMCRAWAMAHMRQHDAAKRKVKEVFEKNPNLSKQARLSMYATAGKVYALLGDTEEARLYLNKVIEMSSGTLFAEEARKDLDGLNLLP